jgi:hypothetical protein
MAISLHYYCGTAGTDGTDVIFTCPRPISLYYWSGTDGTGGTDLLTYYYVKILKIYLRENQRLIRR